MQKNNSLHSAKTIAAAGFTKCNVKLNHLKNWTVLFDAPQYHTGGQNWKAKPQSVHCFPWSWLHQRLWGSFLPLLSLPPISSSTDPFLWNITMLGPNSEKVCNTGFIFNCISTTYPVSQSVSFCFIFGKFGHRRPLLAQTFRPKTQQRYCILFLSWAHFKYFVTVYYGEIIKRWFFVQDANSCSIDAVHWMRN